MASIRLLKPNAGFCIANQFLCKINADEVICYTDGACINNGKLNTLASIGVFWEEDHEDNVSESLGMGMHTNNRAELLAVIQALEIAIQREYHQVLIKTDSELVVRSMNEWLPQWRLNDWRKLNSNRPIKNVDLIQHIDQLCAQIIKVTFEHIKKECNQKAHNLAKKALSKEKRTINV